MEKKQYEEAFAVCLKKTGNTMREMPNPPAEYAACGDGYYFRKPQFLPFEHISTWMTSFFTGEGLLAYHKTKNEEYLDWVKSFAPYYKSKLCDTPMDTMHDLGFLYTLYAEGIYRETGEKEYRDMAVKAADELVKRLNLDCGMIRAWGRTDQLAHHSAGLAIIDCMMNLPLLFFAWQETGNPFYKQAAVMHADHTLKCFIRPDGSVSHGYQYAEAAGVPVGEVNHCGYGEGSFWARGLTWAIYGFALAFRYTEKKEYLETSMKLADRFLAETEKDGGDLIPPWDFRLPAGREKTRDSSAAAIAACAFHEISLLAGKDSGRKTQDTCSVIGKTCRNAENGGGDGDMCHKEGDIYYRAGEKIMERLMSADYLNSDMESSGFLMHSNGLEHCTSFGDYFFMEALLRYMDDFKAYW